LVSNAIWRNVAGFLPATLWAVVVVVLSLSSAAIVPKFDWTNIIAFDKLGHAVFYCILALWVHYGFFRLGQRYRRVEYWTAMLCVAFGIAMELLQGMMRAGRQFEYLDIVADIIGVLIAFWIYSRYLKKQYHGSQ